MRQEDRAAIENMRIDGMKPPTIAAALGLSVNTVYTHIRRHPEIPNTRTCPAARQTRQEVLLERLPDGMVEQPPGSGRAQSILSSGMPVLRKGV